MLLKKKIEFLNARALSEWKQGLTTGVYFIFFFVSLSSFFVSIFSYSLNLLFSFSFLFEHLCWSKGLSPYLCIE